MERDLAKEQAEIRSLLSTEGHTSECADFWADVLVMDAIGERWDHWAQPSCKACDARRAAKGMK
jgi:hypothetical protein